MSARGRPSGLRRDDGMVTAEAAMVLPVLVVLVCAALGAVAVATAQLQCMDAAREGARAAARGETAAVTRARALQSAPRDAKVAVSLVSDRAEVAVVAEVEPFGGLLPSVRVRGRAVAQREPGQR